jgi:uncharacterized protein (TIGR03435 family)
MFLMLLSERYWTRWLPVRVQSVRPATISQAVLIAVAICFGLAVALRAGPQPASQDSAAPSFDVASVRASHSADAHSRFSVTTGRVSATNMNVKMLILMAYRLTAHQIAGAPDWINSEKYDIVAKADGPTNPDQLDLMMRSLLAERFKLAFHRETKEMPVFELVTGKRGPKLRPSTEQADGKHNNFIRRGRMALQCVTMENFAKDLSRVADRNVLDRTGISGVFDISLEWTPDQSVRAMEQASFDAGQTAAAPADSPPPLFTALQEQLGLRLKSGKGPVDVLVVDHVERPTEN